MINKIASEFDNISLSIDSMSRDQSDLATSHERPSGDLKTTNTKTTKQFKYTVLLSTKNKLLKTETQRTGPTRG